MAKIRVTTAQRARRELLEMLEINHRSAVLEWIRSVVNCADADIDRDGDVWIAHPQVGHWMSDAELVDLVNKINKGAER